MDWFESAGEADPHQDALTGAAQSARAALYAVVRKAFDREVGAGRLTRAKIADFLQVSPQAVSRLLRAPQNMTVETAAKLLLAMGSDLKISERSKAVAHPSWASVTHKAMHMIWTTSVRDLPYHEDEQLHFLFAKEVAASPRVRFKTIHGMTIADITNSEKDGRYEWVGEQMPDIPVVSLNITGSDKSLEVHV
ncbi:helix-turn-helix transcriptional regulator [uncultured Brevundimonas sp.]|uniref:helix-turn-helix domain-containing protein n=1 Tax=uncultured Brevundimonas sp. TaxID=213418 RepID=UPI0025CDD079|nr:helix-turn-helix transcriptional regulator [uncultured Brevundimonas sp.]